MKAKNISFIAVAGITTVAFSAFAISSLSNNKNEYIKNVASDTITLNVTSMTSTSLTLSNGYTVPIVSNGFTDGDESNLCSMTAGGYFRTSDLTNHIRGIHSISVTTAGCYVQIVRCVYDYEKDTVITDASGWGAEAQNPTADYSSAPIDFFEIYVAGESGNTWIKSISIDLDKNCSTSSYTFEAEFAPDWSGKTAENPADVYIAGTSELINGSTSANWAYTKMTYDSVSGKYSFSRAVEPGSYVYAFYAVANGGSFDWTGKAIEGDQTKVINDDYLDSNSYSWASEPGYVAPTSYSITFVLNLGWDNNLDWVGLQYSYSNSTTGEVRTESVSTSKEMTRTASSSTYTLSDIDFDGSVCFWFKAYDTTLKGNTNIVSNTTWATGGYIVIRYVPTVCEDVTLTFDVSSYDSVAWTYAYSSATVSPSAAGTVSAANA